MRPRFCRRAADASSPHRASPRFLKGWRRVSRSRHSMASACSRRHSATSLTYPRNVRWTLASAETARRALEGGRCPVLDLGSSPEDTDAEVPSAPGSWDELATRSGRSSGTTGVLGEQDCAAGLAGSVDRLPRRAWLVGGRRPALSPGSSLGTDAKRMAPATRVVSWPSSCDLDPDVRAAPAAGCCALV